LPPPVRSHSCCDDTSPAALQIERILGLCARAQANPAMACRLVAETDLFVYWDRLLVRAEQHGLGPLAYLHMKQTDTLVPQEAQRALKALFLRHRHANGVRQQVLIELLTRCASLDIPVLVLKGAALAFLVYPQPGLRCMRDIDLLVKTSDAQRAQTLLMKDGFELINGPGLPMPARHHHLPVLARQIEGLTVCVEIHDNLFPETRYYPSRRFEDLAGTAIEFQIGDTPARTLGYEELLWHIYRHAVGPPLLASPLRFIQLADLVSLVEAKFEQIDWEKLNHCYPQVSQILPLLHYLTPWSQPVLETLHWDVSRSLKQVGLDYQGWPRHRLRRVGKLVDWNVIKQTIAPPEWWQRLYYAAGAQSTWLWARYIRHPIHLVEWLGHFIREDIAPVAKSPAESEPG
jgi:hypothetical protein